MYKFSVTECEEQAAITHQVYFMSGRYLARAVDSAWVLNKQFPSSLQTDLTEFFLQTSADWQQI